MKKPWRQSSTPRAFLSALPLVLFQTTLAESTLAQNSAPAKELTGENSGDEETKAHTEREKDTVIGPVAVATPIPPLPGNWKPAEVILELTIDAEGLVSRAVLVSGEEPFAATALSATENWEFKPARRNDEPVAAKIHFLVTFAPVEATAPIEATEQNEDEPAPTPSSQGAGQALEEVVVYGKIVDPGSISFSRAEVRNLPGAFDDRSPSK